MMQNGNRKPFFNKRGKPNFRYSKNKVKAYDSSPSTSDSASFIETSSNPIIVSSDSSSGPYKAWKAYLPLEEYEENGEATSKLKIIEKVLQPLMDHKKDEIKQNDSFTVDVRYVLMDKEFCDAWPDFMRSLREAPQKVISYFGLAMHHLLYQESITEIRGQSFDPNIDVEDEHMNLECNMSIVHAQFSGFEVMPLKDIKMNVYKTFVSVRGTVVRIGSVNTLCSKLAFKCNRCSNIQLILQPSGKYTPPKTCNSRPCNSRTFEPLFNSCQAEFISWQNIRIQELLSGEVTEKGRVPRTIECELQRDLVERCVPGDIVTVSGIVKVVEQKEKVSNVVKNKTAHTLYISVNHVECLKEKPADSMEAMPGGLKLDTSDLYAVRDIHDRQDLFKVLVSSLCPNIFGHEIVKAGLLLSLFGGTERFADSENRVHIRGDSHVLLVGDPGLGKSQMLLACANASPRGVYICGNTSTTAGLTVTVSKEAGGDNGLDAGALVLSDLGSCCIDEFDKMTQHHHALLEAMEQQTVSIAKSGMTCILPARASIIAAANPVGGHYNKAKTVSENIKLSSALLSRFDLVFILVDQTDMKVDSKRSKYVIAAHMNKSRQTTLKFTQFSQNNSTILAGPNQLAETLSSNLDVEDEHLISIEQLRKYISYAKKYVHPKLSQEAANILQEFYLDLRKQHQSPHTTPITNRQLESLIRLTEARARLELREECLASDAQEVVDIMKFSMVDTYSDELGRLDFDRSVHGSGMRKQSKAKKFLTVLSAEVAKTNNTDFTFQQLQDIAKNKGLDISGFADLIESLNFQGYLIKKGSRLYSFKAL